MFPTKEEEVTAKQIAQLRHAQKVMAEMQASELPDNNYLFESRKESIEKSKADKRAAKLAKKLARRAV